MADISKINVDGVVHNIKDSVARLDATTEQKGLTMLSIDRSSQSTTLSATPYLVHQAIYQAIGAAMEASY